MTFLVIRLQDWYMGQLLIISEKNKFGSPITNWYITLFVDLGVSLEFFRWILAYKFIQ